MFVKTLLQAYQNMNCFYLQSQIKLREGEVAHPVHDVFVGRQQMVELKPNQLFTKLFDRADIDKHISDLQEYIKENKLHISGYVTIGVYKASGLKFYNLRLRNTKVHEESTFVKILTRKSADDEKEKKKPLSVEDKIELVRKFYEQHGKLPGPAEEMDGFKIGKFLEKLENDNEVLDTIHKMTK